MADRRRSSAQLTLHRGGYVGTPKRPTVNEEGEVLTSSARLIDPGYRNVNVFQYETWQDELWAYLDSIGEFGYAHWWLAQAISRVRIIAAEKIPGEYEPKPLQEGLAADIMSRISDSEIMEGFGMHIPLVGKAFLLMRDEPMIGRVPSVKSADEIRPVRTGIRKSLLKMMGRDIPQGRFELQVEAGAWEPLDNALVSEIKHNHPRYGWRSTSSSRSAIPILREISLLDKHIVATLVSRLAMNGLILFPEGMQFTVNPQYKDAADPLIATWVAIASQNIRNPGAASAALPFPMKVNEKFIDKIKHLPFASGIDPKIIDARRSAIDRLATSMNMSRERIAGMGQVNHWGSWEIKEDEIAMHIVPPVELVVKGLTKTYLHPLLIAAGEPLVSPSGNPIIAWYDTGELTVKPDLSVNAELAYRDGVLKQISYLRYLGFEEADLPTSEELAQIIMLRQALNPGAPPEYLEELTGQKVEIVDNGGETDPSEEDSESPEDQEEQGPPDTQDDKAGGSDG